MLNANEAVTAFTPIMKNWRESLCGPKPTGDLLAKALEFSPHRKVGPQTLALAMRMREKGVTAVQQIAACGAPQNNFSTDKLKGGYFKRNNGVMTGENGHTVYAYELTAKGQSLIDRRAASDAKASLVTADKPVKAVKAKRKAKAKPAAVTAPVDTQAPASEPQGEQAGDTPVNT